MDIQARVPLTDLGGGIWAPVSYGQEIVQRFVHAQFLEDANEYLRKYDNTSLFQYLLEHAQPHLKSLAPLRILDLGSGAGNTIFPLLELYPQAEIVASDLSLPLLTVLRQGLNVKGYGDRCRVMQMNAEELVFEDAQFDFVAGAAILHHLFDPAKAIAEAHRVLKPGGIALFFEPFETGHRIVSRAFEGLIRRSETAEEPLTPEILSGFTRLIEDWRRRQGRDKSDPMFLGMDDKWLFTRSYFEEVSERIGFDAVRTYPLYPIENLFSAHVNTMLSLTAGSSLEALPAWAREYVAALEAMFSGDAKRDLIIEGGVVFYK